METAKPEVKRKKNNSNMIGILLLISGVVLVYLFTLLPPPAARPSVVDSLDRSAVAQKERMKLIDYFMKKRVIVRIDFPGGSLAHAHLGRNFYMITTEKQKIILNLIWSYYLIKDGSMVLVVKRNGKRIARFDEYGMHKI